MFGVKTFTIVIYRGDDNKHKTKNRSSPILRAQEGAYYSKSWQLKPKLKIGGHHTTYIHMTSSCTGFGRNYELPICPLRNEVIFSGCSAIIPLQPGNGATNVDWAPTCRFCGEVTESSQHLLVVLHTHTHMKYGSEFYGYYQLVAEVMDSMNRATLCNWSSILTLHNKLKLQINLLFTCLSIVYCLSLFIICIV